MLAGDRVDMKPITGIAGCCARAASGHAVAPPSSDMKVRRLIGRPSSRLGPHITTPLRKNAAVHHNKNCALMSQMGPDSVLRRCGPHDRFDLISGLTRGTS